MTAETRVWTMIAAILAVGLAFSPQSAGQTAATGPLPANSGQYRDAVAALPSIRAQMDDQLFDYPATRFKNVHFITQRASAASAGIIVICGEMNGKNQLGAYVGWRRFLAMPTSSGDAVLLLGDGAAISTVLDGECVQGESNAIDPRDWASEISSPDAPTD